MKGYRLSVLFFVACVCMLSACKHHGYEPYKGYKMSPYTLRGHHFVPMGIAPALHYKATGLASYYEANGAIGAIGQALRHGELYAAHRTLPLPCRVKITSLSTGRSCEARVADRGPFIRGRIIDVSSAVADKLGFRRKGIDTVRIEVLSVGDGIYERKR